MKPWFLPLFFVLSVPFLQPAQSSVKPPKASETVISGRNWSYTLPFEIKNVADIEKLIQCESQGVNISRKDSNGIYSDGILQFNRSPKTPNEVGSGTWAWMESLSGITGSPLYPADAIRMTDWAISHGLGPQWSCWKIQKLKV